MGARWMLVLCALAGCAESRTTELIVVVESDLGIPAEMDSVRIEVTGPATMTRTIDTPLAAEGARTLPLTLGVSPSDPAVLGPVTVAAAARRAGGEVLRVTRRTTLVRGEARLLVIRLLRSCLGRACGATESCIDGRCGPVDVPFASLPEWTGRLPREDAGTDGGRDGGRDGGDGGCSGDPSCDDGRYCNGEERCVGGACAPGVPPICTDDVACTADACDDSGQSCVNAPNDALCTAGPGGRCDRTLDCQYDVCDGTTCTAGPCQTARCEGTTCIRTTTCTDGMMCCGGSCVPAGCDDGNACTNDSCEASGCANVPNDNPCDDGNACTVSDRCDSGSCGGGGSLGCDDGNYCTDDGCDPGGGCYFVNNSRGCDDGNPCTGGDACAGGSCRSGGPIGCDDGNPCTDDYCDPGSGCASTPNGNPCDDGDPCTIDEYCSGGSCGSGSPIGCDDGNPCTDDYCSGGGCNHDPNMASCDDGRGCGEDACRDGSCVDICTLGDPSCYCNGSYCEHAFGGFCPF